MNKKIFILFVTAAFALNVFAANRYWIGTGDNNWNNTANWSAISGGIGGASLPGINDTAVFDGNGIVNCLINTSVNVNKFNVLSGYTGTITQGTGNSITIGSGGAIFSGGVFAGGNSAISITTNGGFTLSGTNFISTSGNLQCKNWNFSSGTFNHNNGRVVLLGILNNSSGSTVFSRLTLSGGTIGASYSLAGGTVFTVDSTFEITGTGDVDMSGGSGASIDAKGNITITNTGTGGSGNLPINIIGTGNQTVSNTGISGQGKLINVNVNKPSGTLFLAGTISIFSTWAHAAGTVDPGTSTVVFFGRTSVQLNLAGNIVFHNLIFTNSSGINQAWGIPNITVNGTLTISGSSGAAFAGGTINARGNITVTNSSTAGGGTTNVLINGTADQTLTGKGVLSQGNLPSVTINKPSGTLFLSSLITVANNFTYVSGTVDASTNNSTVALLVTGNTHAYAGSMAFHHLRFHVSSTAGRTVAFSTGTTWTVNGTLTISGNNTVNFSGSNTNIDAFGDIIISRIGTGGAGGTGFTTLNIKGSANQVFTGNGVAGTGGLPNITINKTGGTLELSSIISVGGSWTYTAGTVAAGFSTVAFYNSNNIDGEGNSSTMAFNNVYLFANTRTLTGNLIANGDVKIYSGAVLNQNSKAITIGGNWDNSGTYTTSPAMVTFNGSANQSLIKSAGSETFTRVNINKSSGNLTLSSPVVINDSLKLTKGVVISTSTNYVRLIDNAKASGGADTAFVSGFMRKLGNDAFVFPIGDNTLASGKYHPVEITAPVSLTDEFSAEYLGAGQSFGNTTDSSLSNLSNCEYWNVNQVAGTSSVSVTMNWNSNSCNITSQLNDMRVARWNGTKWADLGNGGTTGNNTKGSVTTASATSAFGAFALAQTACSVIANAGQDKLIQSGQNTTIGSSYVSGNTYSWSPAIGLSSTVIANPVASPSNSTMYVLTTTNTNGCAATDTVKVFVLHPQVNSPTRTFIRNDGQVADENGNTVPEIKYQTSGQGVNAYYSPTSIRYVFPKYKEVVTASLEEQVFFQIDTNPSLVLDSLYRMDLEFVNGNSGTSIIAQNEFPTYNNYYYEHVPNGVLNVPEFGKIIYNNVYSNIDLIFYYTATGLKSNFVVKPGGNPDDIQFRYNGAENISISSDGSLSAINRFGNIVEGIPFAFQGNANPSLVSCSFQLNSSIVSFNVGAYNASDTLVIDPTIVWGTYYGNIGEDYGNSVAVDKNSNQVYLCGFTTSTLYLSSTGAHQPLFGGGSYDAFLSKFSASGTTRLWATYYGGNSDDFGRGVVVDNLGDIIICGNTSSTTAIATSTPQVIDNTYNGGGSDGFIAKFNPNNGQRIWGTYYGGGSSDMFFDIVCDLNNRIYIAGNTRSSGIATSGSHQSSYNGAGVACSDPYDVYPWVLGDGFLARFSSNGQIIDWGTYVGGAKNECLFKISINNNKGLLSISGVSSSVTLPGIATINQTSFGGGCWDGYLSVFDLNGIHKWGTYYGGNDFDQCGATDTDDNDNLYVTGQTSSLNNIATIGSFIGGSSDAFLAKFNSVGVRQWGRYFGGNDLEMSFSIAIGNCQAIFVGGITGSNTGIATPGSPQPTMPNFYLPGFLSKFTVNGVLHWGTYYGGAHTELDGTQIRDIDIDFSGNIITTGRTSSYDVAPYSISTSGAYQNNLFAYNDAFVAKYQDDSNPQPSVSNLNIIGTCAGGNGGSISLTLNGGNPPFTFLWTPSNQNTLNAVNLSPGNYQLTVTDALGCTFIYSPFVVPTVTNTNASFTMNANNLCVGNPGLSFTNNTTGLYPPFTYLWSFSGGAPSSSTATNPSGIVYNTPGIYFVSLTATDVTGCSVTTTQAINIAGNCCANPSNVAYTPGFDNPSTPVVYTSNQNWISNLRIASTVFVRAPAILTIASGVTIEFGPLGKIILENGTGNSGNFNGAGAQLILNPSCTLTSITSNPLYSNCPVMWPGVEVWGNSSYRSSNASSFNPNLYGGQGKVTMNSGAIIENAHIGVLLGKKSTCIPGTLVKCAFFDIGSSGGIIIANGGKFNMNATSIEFFPYNKNNTSIIQNCQFTGGQISLLDPGYITPNLVGYTYPDANNPYYAPADPGGGFTPRLLYLWGVKNINIWDNIFQNAGAGVQIYNARSIIRKNTIGNTFNNLGNGIGGYYNNSTLFGNSITDNIFEDMSLAGVWITGGNGEQIKNNIFHDPNSLNPLTKNNTYGIVMSSSNFFNIEDNSFFKWKEGVRVFSNSFPPTTGSIGFFQTGNSFTQCSTSVITTGNNLNLRIRCNIFNPDATNPSFWSGSNWNNNGSLGTQGNYPALSDFDPAGNDFNPGNPGNLDGITSSSQYIYHHHIPSALFPAVRPTPQGILTNSDIIPATGFSKTQTSCGDPCAGNPSCRIAQMSNLSNRIGTLQIEFNNVFANLDHGQTSALLSAISGNTSNDNLKNMLLQNSPLSDEVLLAFINRNGTPPGHFKEVVIPNSPVSDDVRPTMLAKLASMPQGVSKQIKEAQGSQTNRTLTAISREILSARTQYNLALADAVSLYVEADSVDVAIALLEAENTVEADQILVATYLEQGLLADAENKLNNISITSQDIQAFVDLHIMLLDLMRDSLTVFDIDSAQETLVRNIAAMSPSLAYANAWAILKQVFNEEPPVPSLSRIGQGSTNDEYMPINETNYLGENFPNPFSKNTIIPYFLPENSGGYIKVYDVKGTLMNSYLLMEGNNFIEVNTENLSSGVYYYSMEVDRIRIQNKKMVLINKE